MEVSLTGGFDMPRRAKKKAKGRNKNGVAKSQRKRKLTEELEES